MNIKYPYHVLLCYKNFSKECGITHIGLGVTAAFTCKTLMQAGVFAQALPIFGADDLETYILSQKENVRPITHVLIMAQWIPTQYLALLCRKFPQIVFGLKCHSNAAFLGAEPPAITLLREAIDLEIGNANFHACVNNQRLGSDLKGMYGRPVTFLPNLYYLHGQEPIHRSIYSGGMLRIAIFGSHRIQKNMSTAVAAAIYLANQMKVTAEIWMNGGRSDGAGNIVNRTAIAWTDHVPNITLKELKWSSWPEFKRVIGTMHIHLAPSWTETFCNVVADGIVEGVPSVVTTAMEWCPRTWQADGDDPSEIAIVARRLLSDPQAAQEGYAALQRYVKAGIQSWLEFLAS
jgi:hypothetical protein